MFLAILGRYFLLLHGEHESCLWYRRLFTSLRYNYCNHVWELQQPVYSGYPYRYIGYGGLLTDPTYRYIGYGGLLADPAYR